MVSPKKRKAPEEHSVGTPKRSSNNDAKINSAVAAAGRRMSGSQRLVLESINEPEYNNVSEILNSSVGAVSPMTPRKNILDPDRFFTPQQLQRQQPEPGKENINSVNINKSIVKTPLKWMPPPVLQSATRSGVDYPVSPSKDEGLVMVSPSKTRLRREAAEEAARLSMVEPEPRLVISKLVLENFKSYAGAQTIGPFNSVSLSPLKSEFFYFFFFFC